MSKRIAGVCYFKVGGTQYSIAGDCTVSPEDFERESLSGLSGTVGFKESPTPPSIEVEMFTENEVDITKIAAIDDDTVTAELANGQVWALRNAWKVGRSDMSANEGKMTVKFEGPKCERVA